MIKRHIGAAANLICTQPRRISALGLADRVSDERCSRVGDEIGYAIRGESKQKSGTTKITFVTIGVLLRRLQTSGGTKDDIVAALTDVSHVVVDEVHERSLDVVRKVGDKSLINFQYEAARHVQECQTFSMV